MACPAPGGPPNYRQVAAWLATAPGGGGGPWWRTGWTGWCMLAAAILAYDAFAPETMSDAWARRQVSPRARAARVAAWSYLTAHLFGLLPRSADPLHLAHAYWEGRRDGLALAAAARLRARPPQDA